MKGHYNNVGTLTQLVSIIAIKKYMVSQEYNVLFVFVNNNSALDLSGILVTESTISIAYRVLRIAQGV